MGIQEDIKQRKAFRNEYQKLAVNLLFSTSWLTETFKQVLEPYDVTMQQFNILRILRGAHPEPLTTMEIRERMLDKMSDVSRIVDRMISKNLVTKSVCPADKRLVDVNIADKGIMLLEQLDLLEQEMDGHLAHLTTQEAKILNDLLDKMRGSSK